MERSGVHPTTKFAYRKNLCTRDALLCVGLQSALESGREPKIVQFEFNAAFNRVGYRRILNKLC